MRLQPCKQWFLQAGCYAMKGEIPLRATVCFSIEHLYIKMSNDITFFSLPGIIRNFRIQQHDSNEKIKITICLIKQNYNLHLHHSFLYISLLFAN